MTAITLSTLAKMKQDGDKITCLTAYDYSFASLMDSAGIDVVLIGDSLGMVIQGHESTLPVTLDDAVYHSLCVTRGARRALRVGDMPFMSYQANREVALASAGRLMQEGGVQVVKLEGGEVMAETVRFLVDRRAAKPDAPDLSFARPGSGFALVSSEPRPLAVRGSPGCL